MKLGKLLNIGAAVVALLLVWYICAFYVIDLDVWWHIAAGRIMRSTAWLIQTEPFAYTRLGEPYLATQSWLAQIILSIVYDVTGATGLIIFRSVLITLAVLPALLLRKQNNWLFAPFVIFAAASLRPVILDRPQLFSYAIFSGCLYVAWLWLQDRITTKQYLFGAIALQILWVNLHGGAALLHFVILAGVLVETWDTAKFKTSATLAGFLVAALFVSPNFLHTFGYVQDLFTDNTVQFIQEWLPRKPWNYMRWTFSWWLLSLLAVFVGRRYITLSLACIIVFGFFSLQAIRHEPFFILSALLIIAWQLDSEHWQTILGRLQRIIWVPLGISVLGIISVTFLAHQDKYIATGRLGLNGYGTYQPVQGAYEFLEQQNITGNIFHNYDAGAHLDFLGYPDRKTFVDGRNVDFGYDFLEKLFSAQYDQRVFRELQAEYQFNHVLIYYQAYQEVEDLPYVVYLQNFADWSLVFVDDDSAVYVLRSEYPAVPGYKYLRPEMLRMPSSVLTNTTVQQSVLQAEVQRAIEASPSSVRLPLVLAASYMQTGQVAEAESLITTVIDQVPYDFAGYNLLALLRVRQERYAEAGTLFEQAIAAGGGAKGTVMDYEDLSWVFEMAGNEKKSRYYLEKAQ